MNALNKVAERGFCWAIVTLIGYALFVCAITVFGQPNEPSHTIKDPAVANQISLIWEAIRESESWAGLHVADHATDPQWVSVPDLNTTEYSPVTTAWDGAFTYITPDSALTDSGFWYSPNTADSTLWVVVKW